MIIMMKNIRKYMFLLAVLSGCKNSLKNDLIKKVDQEYGSHTAQGCTIVFRKVTKFKWDKMYLFGSWTMPDSITRVIKTTYDGDYVPDDNTRLLFTYNNQIVYEEDLSTLSYDSSIIYFPNVIDSLLRAKSNYFTPSTAVFKVEKEKIENSRTQFFDYYFIPIK